MTASENRLLVEGDEDRRVLPELLERAGINWGPKGAEIVKIHALDGFGNFTPDEIALQLKTSGLRRLGILVDADEDPAARWRSLRSTLSGKFALPDTSSANGLVLSSGTLRFGVWMMPDNLTRGMLETFLLALRPQNQPDLLGHAETSTDTAKSLGATFSASHRDKALIHTWLASQDPPGRQLHQAIQERMLDPAGPFATAFVAWFKDLFEIP
ncbi:MAG: hypothetical protein HY791_30900 [Deltaproteobacteria bacterium]|nr:hypothetical protein [Deltaproteobacteria bacterium]